jgi:50S ribosomal protein L16 3-hydroxylase
MSGVPLGALSPEQFLTEYWQRKPLLVRNAFPGFTPPIDGDDLAGLACEPLAEARVVSGSLAGAAWTLRHGPFEEQEFAGLGERDWTLLVQDVEKHYPPLAELLDAFAFLPSWRLDDIMISFAAPGGSVGPHVDQYDVFLLQADGHRRWQIATDFDPAPAADLPLDMLANFRAQQEWLLGPGDMLYLPPGVAHHGVAEDACLTYSIGLRAPSAADLLLALEGRPG